MTPAAIKTRGIHGWKFKQLPVCSFAFFRETFWTWYWGNHKEEHCCATTLLKRYKCFVSVEISAFKRRNNNTNRCDDKGAFVSLRNQTMCFYLRSMRVAVVKILQIACLRGDKLTAIREAWLEKPRDALPRPRASLVLDCCLSLNSNEKNVEELQLGVVRA